MHKELKKGYARTNRVHYVEQILWYVDRHTALTYMEDTLRALFEEGATIPNAIRTLDIAGQGFTNTRFAHLNNRNQHEPSFYTPTESPDETRMCGAWPDKSWAHDVKRASRKFNLEDPFHINAALRTYLKHTLGPEHYTRWFGKDGEKLTCQNKFQFTIYNSIRFLYRAHRNPDVVQDVILSAQVNNSEVKHANPAFVYGDRNIQPEEGLDTFEHRIATIPIMYLQWVPDAGAAEFPGLDPSASAFPGQWTGRGRKPKFQFEPVNLVYCLPLKYKTASGLPSLVHGSVLVAAQPLAAAFIRPIEDVEGPIHLVPFDETSPAPAPGRTYIVNNYVDVDMYWRI